MGAGGQKSHREHGRVRNLAPAMCVLSAFSLLAAAGCTSRAPSAGEAGRSEAGRSEVQRSYGPATVWWEPAHPRAARAASGWNIRTVVGGVGGPAAATNVSVNQPCGVTWSGKTLLAGTADGVVRAVNTRTDRLTNPAGVGYNDDFLDVRSPAPGPDGSAAGAAHFYLSCDVAVDHHGNLVLSDSSFLTGDETQTDRIGDDRVRVVAASNGTFYGQPMTKGKIYTIAGTGTFGYSGDGGPARSAEVGRPAGLAVDGSGNILVATADGAAGLSPGGHIRVIAAASGRFYGQQMTAGDIYTIAGGGSGCPAGSAGRAATGVALGLRTLFFQKYAPVGAPSGLRIDHAGNIVIAATSCRQVDVVASSDGTFYGRKMTAGGIYVVAGGGSADPGDGHPATGSRLNQPVGVALDRSGDIVIAESVRNRVRLVAARSGEFFGQQMVRGDIYTVAGGHGSGFSGDGGPARRARLDLPAGVAVDGNGNIAVADFGNHRIRLVAAASGSYYNQPMKGGDIYTIAGNGLTSFSGDRGPASRAQFGIDSGSTAIDDEHKAAVDGAGNLLIEDGRNLRLVAGRSAVLFGHPMRAGHVYTLAHFAKDARVPESVVFDRAGNAVVAALARVEVVAARSGTFYRRAMKAGGVYVIGGSTSTTKPNGVPATKAGFRPLGVAVDNHGNVIVSAEPKIGMSGGYISVIAASSGTFYGRAMRAGYIYALSTGGNVYCADHHGNLIFGGEGKVEVIAGRDGTFYGQPMTTGHVYTVAGTGEIGSSGDGGPATAAKLTEASVAVDAPGNLLIVDDGDQPRIRVVAAATGTFYGHPMKAGDIYTIAGGGTSLANEVPPLSAMLTFDDFLAAAPDGGILVFDRGGQRFRLIGR